MIKFFQFFQAQVENKYNTKIKTLRLNEGGEFKLVIQLAKTQGIQIQLECSYTSLQNGKVERKHKYVVETGLSLSPSKNASFLLVGSIPHSSFSHQQNLSPVSENKNLYFLMTNLKLDYEFLKIFGSAWPY